MQASRREEEEEEAKDLPFSEVTSRFAVMAYCHWTPNGQIRGGPASSASHIPPYPVNRYGTWPNAYHIKEAVARA